jgi:hypothetical protein
MERYVKEIDEVKKQREREKEIFYANISREFEKYDQKRYS